MDKAQIRKIMHERRQGLSIDERAALSCKTAQNVLSWRIYEGARNVLLYYPFGGEIDLLGLAKTGDGKRFYLPKVTDAENKIMAVGVFGENTRLIKGRYGIPEPEEISGAEIDLIIAPAVACDIYGNRIGFGAGYYDRFLAKIKEKNAEKAVIAAAVYDFQITDKLESETHDVRMDYIISPAGIIRREVTL